MTKPLPFTKASVKRLIAAVEAAGKHVVGFKPDGTLLIGDKPVDAGAPASILTQDDDPYVAAVKGFHAKAARRRHASP